MKNILLLTSCLLFAITGNAQIKSTKKIKESGLSVNKVQKIDKNAKVEVHPKLLVNLKKELQKIYEQSTSYEDFLQRVAIEKRGVLKKRTLSKEQKEVLHTVYQHLKNGAKDTVLLKENVAKTHKLSSDATFDIEKATRTDYFWESAF